MQTSNYNLGLGDLINRAQGRFYYLASPYTHDDQQVIERRVELAHEYFAEFTLHGIHIHNATYETHRAARTHRLPTHYQFWLEHNSAFIRPSAGVIVAELDGWDESKGVRSEIQEARDLGLPVYRAFLHPVARHLYVGEMFHARTHQDNPTLPGMDGFEGE